MKKEMMQSIKRYGSRINHFLKNEKHLATWLTVIIAAAALYVAREEINNVVIELSNFRAEQMLARTYIIGNETVNGTFTHNGTCLIITCPSSQGALC